MLRPGPTAGSGGGGTPGALVAANNLSDVASPSAALGNIGGSPSGTETTEIAAPIDDPGHGHGFTGTTQHESIQAFWNCPAGAGDFTVFSATASGDAQPKAIDGEQFDYARAPRIVLGGGWGNPGGAVVVTFVGQVFVGAPGFRTTITIPADSNPGDVIEFDTAGPNLAFRPYVTLSSIEWSGTFVGDFTVEYSDRLGIPGVPYYWTGTMVCLSESGNGADTRPQPQAIGTVYNAAGGDGVGPFYKPTLAPNGSRAHVACFYYQRVIGGSVASNSTGISSPVHTHETP